MAESTPYLQAVADVRDAVQRLAIDRGYMLGEVAIHFADRSRHVGWMGPPREGDLRATLIFEKGDPAQDLRPLLAYIASAGAKHDSPDMWKLVDDALEGVDAYELGKAFAEFHKLPF